MNTLIFNLC